MKKLQIMSAIAVLAMIISASNLFAQDTILKIAQVEGNVFVKAPSADWVPAKAGQVINQKDVVKTDDGAKAVLEFPDKSSFAMKPNSQLSVDELVWTAAARKVNVSLSVGELKAVIQKSSTPSEFKVKTPTAICGARGTIFYIAVFADGTSVYVDQGSVDFLNSMSYESYTILEGNTSNANADGTTTTRELSPQEKAALLSGWGVTVPVAEPYSDPTGGGTTGDVFTPEGTPEDQASRT